MKKAFSLVELIVVITIIALVSVAGMVSYTSAQKKSRDARRMSDLSSIRMALEMARQVGVTYPGTLNALTPTYIQSVPVDPKGGAYDYVPTNYTYTLSATMEDLGSTNGSFGVFNYRVTNP